MDWNGPLLIDPAAITPKGFLIAVMRDPDAPIEARMQAAKDVAPYVHARLANVEHSVTVRRSLADYSDAELQAIAGATANGQLQLDTTAEEAEAEPDGASKLLL